MEYVVGFRINPETLNVVLIQKNKPEWQSGLYNGVGGKIEEGETAEEAMKREFLEETGLKVIDWTKTIVLTGNNFQVSFFRSYGNTKLVKTMTDEKVHVIDIREISKVPTIKNLQWIVPMQLDNLEWPIEITDLTANEAAHAGN